MRSDEREAMEATLAEIRASPVEGVWWSVAVWTFGLTLLAFASLLVWVRAETSILPGIGPLLTVLLFIAGGVVTFFATIGVFIAVAEFRDFRERNRRFAPRYAEALASGTVREWHLVSSAVAGIMRGSFSEPPDLLHAVDGGVVLVDGSMTWRQGPGRRSLRRTERTTLVTLADGETVVGTASDGEPLSPEWAMFVPSAAEWEPPAPGFHRGRTFDEIKAEAMAGGATEVRVGSDGRTRMPREQADSDSDSDSDRSVRRVLAGGFAVAAGTFVVLDLLIGGGFVLASVFGLTLLAVALMLWFEGVTRRIVALAYCLLAVQFFSRLPWRTFQAALDEYRIFGGFWGSFGQVIPDLIFAMVVSSPAVWWLVRTRGGFGPWRRTPPDADDAPTGVAADTSADTSTARNEGSDVDGGADPATETIYLDQSGSPVDLAGDDLVVPPGLRRIFQTPDLVELIGHVVLPDEPAFIRENVSFRADVGWPRRWIIIGSNGEYFVDRDAPDGTVYEVLDGFDLGGAEPVAATPWDWAMMIAGDILGDGEVDAPPVIWNLVQSHESPPTPGAPPPDLDAIVAAREARRVPGSERRHRISGLCIIVGLLCVVAFVAQLTPWLGWAGGWNALLAGVAMALFWISDAVDAVRFEPEPPSPADG